MPRHILIPTDGSRHAARGIRAGTELAQDLGARVTAVCVIPPYRPALDYEGGRNGARGPNYQRLDLRAGYRVRLGGGRTLDAFLDIFILTNEANFANPTNNGGLADRRLAATFLQLTALVDGSPTRTAQINLRFGF